MFRRVFEDNLATCLQSPEASLLFAFWAVARKRRDIPDEAAMPLQRISPFRDDLMILRPLGGDWTYEHYGRTIAMHAGFDMTGKRVSDFQGAVGAFYAEIYGRVRSERRPLATLHRLGHFGERPLWERMILPVGTPEGIEALYVVNKVRDLEKDISQLTVRARNRGLIVLQFIRDENKQIVDSRIIGANRLALRVTGRRLDQLIGKSMLDEFPGLRAAGLWDRYLIVAERQSPEVVEVPYRADGVEGRFRVQISPMLDGVTVDFEELAGGSDLLSERRAPADADAA